MTPNRPIKVLIVDDSALIRQTYKALLETENDIQVIGTANDPYIAVQKIQKETPDVITLDIEMPRMDGITFLKKLMAQAPMPVIVISNQTVKGVDIALRALEYGAVEVMAKPQLGTESHMEESRIRLVDAVRSAYHSKVVRKRGSVAPAAVASQPVKPTAAAKGITFKKSIIAIGASTGGTEALKTVLEKLPAHMPPILIVQHMPEKFTTSFANRLNQLCQLHVKEAENNETVQAGTVYIAPGNYHMEIKSRANGEYFIHTFQGELVNRHRPSVNVLFESVAKIGLRNTVGLIMTGMGDDGATGLKHLFDTGAHTLVQDEASCAVFGMPKKALDAGGVKETVSLQEISGRLIELASEQH